MNKPLLMDNVEKKLISIIDAQECETNDSTIPIDPKTYIQLADLYRFHKDFKNEAAILNRFMNLDRVASEVDVMDLMHRIERAYELSNLIKDNPQPNIANKLVKVESSLKLEGVNTETDQIVNRAKPKTIVRVDTGKGPFLEKQHIVLSVCAICTGRSDQDEVLQLALELFSFNPLSKDPVSVIDTFNGYRKTLVKVPDNMEMRFNLSQVDKKNMVFDKDRIVDLFSQADFVVSHSDAEIDRKLIATLVPEVAVKPWYSSQKDIPWIALGFESSRLAQISIALELKAPKVAFERAKAIRLILQKKEVDTCRTYLERLYNMHPIKKFRWTESLTKQYKKLKNARQLRLFKIYGFISVIIFLGIIGYYGFV